MRCHELLTPSNRQVRLQTDPPPAAVRLLSPIAIVGVLALGWALPLAWTSVLVTTAAIGSLAGVSLWHALRAPGGWAAFGHTATAAACCLSGTGLIGLGYAAFALTHSGAFGPATRLGYPFLIGTRLYLRGGLGLLMLCGLVSVIPLLFRHEA